MSFLVLSFILKFSSTVKSEFQSSSISFSEAALYVENGSSFKFNLSKIFSIKSIVGAKLLLNSCFN